MRIVADLARMVGNIGFFKKGLRLNILFSVKYIFYHAVAHPTVLLYCIYFSNRRAKLEIQISFQDIHRVYPAAPSKGAIRANPF